MQDERRRKHLFVDLMRQCAVTGPHLLQYKALAFGENALQLVNGFCHCDCREVR